MHPSPPLPETLTAWLESLPEPHILFDRHYRILAANAAYLRQYGQGRPVLGRTCHEVSHHSSVPCDQAGESWAPSPDLTCRVWPLARSITKSRVVPALSDA